MPTTRANGIDVFYEESGSTDDPALLLVNGYTSQLISWEDSLIDGLVDAGFRVIRFDNRDVGLTQKTDGRPPQLVASGAGLPALDAPPPYTLSDMAADGIGLLDALGIDKAHVAGVSMGGMIVQLMAVNHPDRVLTMTSIMSSTGDRKVAQATPEAMTALLTKPPSDREAFIDHGASTARVICGPYYDEARARRRAANAFDRAYQPIGAAFQMAAVLSDGDRTERLASVRCPALVIHGAADPLVTLSGGEATARAIPGAELLVLDEMGHDLVPQAVPDVVAAIAKLAARA